jgi:hypothetical protein
MTVESQVVPVLNNEGQCHEGVWGSGFIDPHFLDLGTTSLSGQLHVSAALPPGKLSWYWLDRRLDGPQNRSGHCGEKKILDPTGSRTPTPLSSSSQPVAISTALSGIKITVCIQIWIFANVWIYECATYIEFIHNVTWFPRAGTVKLE